MAGRSPASGRNVASRLSSSFTKSSLKAPIYNPYDKFTQPEFDAWIGDITGALKRALGQEEPAPRPAKYNAKNDDTIYDEEAGEDSFAALKARRAAKGKQRATYNEVDEDELDDREVELSILVDKDASEEEGLKDEDATWEANSAWGQDEVSFEGSEDEGPQMLGDVEAPIEISDDEDEGTQTVEVEANEYAEGLEEGENGEYDEDAEDARVRVEEEDEEEEGEEELEEDETDETQKIRSDEIVEAMDNEADDELEGERP
jgi:hypothetical protein